ncbi:FecR family protein [Spirosoma linguale]|uniref:Anti-FecI sigma factor, FecR n=1 Tax=Spirosoma linguale (strain ATCC 33905 / DSM 74 / LMG 10896 / Claus 1) TaxID=504472 RepID=D2QI34_SPILD|nr:anti-FecI sigma factor, FecR [Spirosoma linguale DSM 74]
MKRYQHYTVEEFLTDSWFLAWAKHQHPEARQFWEEWQLQNPAQRHTLLLAKDMAEALKHRPHALTVEQELLEVERIVKLARPGSIPSRGVRHKASWNRYGWLAALGFMMLGAGWWISHRQSSVTQLANMDPDFGREHRLTNQWFNQVNGTSQPITLSLPDGSQLTLMAHSQASYPRSFDADKREVYLKGDAFFSVVHEGKRPFLVYSGTLVTRVLGTRFRVQARPGEAHLRVSVLSGKVSVMDHKAWMAARSLGSKYVSGVVLTANQQVTYDPGQHSYQKELVPEPIVISTVAESPETFNFDDAPATNVFERLKKAYGVEIIYDASVLQSCTLTASLAGIPLHNQLQLLCASIGASYEVVDTRIIITSKGCP